MKALIVEDDVMTAKAVKEGLAARAWAVDLSHDGADGSFMGKSFNYDAIILDYALPKKDGLAVCRDIRLAGRKSPIIFLSAAGDTDLKVSALKTGADDYMTKPFSIDELLARVEAAVRRAPEPQKSSILQVSDLTLDQESNAVRRAGRLVKLTRKEYSMLLYFMQNAGRVLSRPQIMEHVWTADGNPFSNAIESHIRNLRKKLCGKDGPNLVMNVPGRGYMLDTPENLKKLA